MKKHFYYLFLCFALMAMQFVFVSCEDKEVEKPFVGKNYLWDIKLPYDSNNQEIKTKWIGDDIHSPWQYDSVYHSMRVQYDYHGKLYIEESFVAEYSQAYRYIATTDTDDYARVFIRYPENWVLFDTNYTVAVNKRTSFDYKGEYPNLSFKTTALIMNQSIFIGSTPDFDQLFMPWGSDLSYSCHFLTIDSCKISFPIEYNNAIRDTIARTFIMEK